MTITNTSCENFCDGNGITQKFAYTFQISDATDLQVILTDSTGGTQVLTYLSDFTLDGVGAKSGGYIYLTNITPTRDEKLALYREMPLRQDVSIRYNTEYFPDAIEDAIDTVVLQLQQQANQVQRCIRLPISADTSNFDAHLPSSPQGNPGKTIVTNGAGTGFQWGPAVVDLAITPASVSSCIASAAVASTSATLASQYAASALTTLASCSSVYTCAAFVYDILKLQVVGTYTQSTTLPTHNLCVIIDPTTNAGMVVTLPSASATGCSSKKTIVHNCKITTNSFVISATGTDLIDGVTSITVTSPYGTRTLVPDGSGSWAVIYL